MKSSKILSLILIFTLVISLGLSGCGSQESTQNESPAANEESDVKEKTVIQVGYPVFLSGAGAAMGKIIDTGVQLALEDFNSTSETVQIELFVADAGDTPIASKNAVEKVLGENPPIVASFLSSTNFVGAGELFEQEKVPVVVCSTLGTIFEHGWDWVFGIMTPGTIEAPLAIQYYNEKLGKKKIAVMVSNDDTGKSVVASLNGIATKNNITIIPVYFNNKDNDYTANITAARRENPDMYYINTPLSPDLAKIVKQIKQLGITETVAVNHYVTNSDFLDLLSEEEAEGLYGSVPAYANMDKPEIKAFSDRVMEKIGKPADQSTLLAYDESMVVFQTLEKAGADREKILETLRTTTYTGLAGVYKFDERGLGRKDTNIMQIGPDKKLIYLDNIKLDD